MSVTRRLSLAAFFACTMMVAATGTSHAVNKNKCASGKNKCSTTKLKALLNCHVKAEGKGIAVDATCLQKAEDKFDGGADPTKGCFEKLENKEKQDKPETLCPTKDDTAAIEAKIDAFVTDLVTELDPTYPAVAAKNKCSSGKKKCASAKVAALIGCYSKIEGKGGLVDPACLQKAKNKFDGGADPAKGCFEKLENKEKQDKPETLCPTKDDTAAIEAKIDTFVNDLVCAVDPSIEGCPVVPVPTPTPTLSATPTVTATPQTLCVGGAPNGTKEGGEVCDPNAGGADAQCPNVNNTDFPCTSNCTCNCPTKIAFIGNVTRGTCQGGTNGGATCDAASTCPGGACVTISSLDTGWTGISHDAAIIGEGKITVTVGGCAGVNGRPCGVCNLGGPVNNVNAGAGDLDDERCSGNTSIKCNVDGDCAGFGTCEIFFGSLLPLSAGGVSTCVENRVVGSLTGTANIETGESTSTLNLNSRVWLGAGGDPVNQPCPVCAGDGAPNDGTAGGTCSTGARAGLACDINGTHPLGNTSLDCPITLNGAGTIANLPIPLQSTTGTATRTLSAANPTCRAAGHTTEKCFCDTCDNAASTPCSANADCVAVGATVCGGKRCVGGTNNGAPCTANSECGAGGFCQTPGTATAPNQCNPPDGAPDGCQPDVGNEGLCTDGPLDQNCAPPEAQRGCTIPTQAADCPITGTCVPKNRECFLDNGLLGGQLVATGTPDAPVNDVANPKLATIFCIGFTGSTSVNGTAGLPGPGRLSLFGQARGLP